MSSRVAMDDASLECVTQNDLRLGWKANAPMIDEACTSRTVRGETLAMLAVRCARRMTHMASRYSAFALCVAIPMRTRVAFPPTSRCRTRCQRDAARGRASDVLAENLASLGRLMLY